MDKAYICGPMSTVISLQEFTALYTEYSRRFTDIAFSYLQDRQEAEDVVSESFMAFWTGRENTPLAQHLPSYILGIVKHKCMDTLRSRESTDRRCRNIYQQACRDAKVRVLGNDELTQQLFRDDPSAASMDYRTGCPCAADRFRVCPDLFPGDAVLRKGNLCILQ